MLDSNHYVRNEYKGKLFVKMKTYSDCLNSKKDRDDWSYIQNSRYEELSSTDDAVFTDAVALDCRPRSPPSIIFDVVVALCYCCTIFCFSALIFWAINNALQRNYFRDVEYEQTNLSNINQNQWEEPNSNYWSIDRSHQLLISG